MSVITSRSRNILLIKDDIIYKRHYDLEDDITSTIWIEVKVPKIKPFLISSIANGPSPKP